MIKWVLNNDYMAMRAAHDAEDQWKAQDFYDVFLDGYKGYTQMTDKELLDEFEGQCSGLNTMEFTELWNDIEG